MGLSRSGWAWDAKLADFDNDGRLEALQAVGFVRGHDADAGLVWRMSCWAMLQELATGNDVLLKHPAAWFSMEHVASGLGCDLSGNARRNPFYVLQDSGRYVDVSSQPRPGILPFAIAITVLNVLGHTWLGFEQAWLTPIVALVAAYLSEIATELAIKGWAGARCRGGPRHLAVFLLPAHITGLAVGMLLYTNERFVVVAFAASLAIFSKVLLRVPVPGAAPGVTSHYMNPSNLGIAATLLLFSDWVGVAQPYQFTENVSGALDWVIPRLIVCSGSLLNWRATQRLTLVLAWLAGFVGQALVRSWLAPQELLTLLAPMTGMAFVLFTFYMVSDPMTTPRTRQGQIVFGVATAALYGLLTHAGMVFGLFFSLCLVCAGRGARMSLASRRARVQRPAPVIAAVSPVQR